MASLREAFFVGSVSPEAARTPDEAFRIFYDATLAKGIDIPSLPGGETDDPNWIGAPMRSLREVSALWTLKRSTFQDSGNYFGMPVYLRKPGRHIDPAELDLNFARRIRTIYPALQALAAERGVAPPRVQLGINTLDVALFALRFGAKREIGSFVEATRREAAEVWETTQGNVFYLLETPCATISANLFRGREGVLRWFAQTLADVAGALPASAGWGFHFCYGDLSNSSVGDHGRLAEALKLRRVIYHTQFSVAVMDRILRQVEDRGLVPELLHVPLALGKRPPSLDVQDYQPYRSLQVQPQTKIFAGAIHAQRTADELRTLYPALDEVFGRRVGMANSCGFGRHSADRMATCLDHLTAVAST